MSSLLAQLATSVQNWHSQKLAHLKEVSEMVEEGTTLKLKGTDGKSTEVVVTAREALIFQLGIEAAIGEFEKLPFTVTTKDDDCDDDTDG